MLCYGPREVRDQSQEYSLVGKCLYSLPKVLRGGGRERMVGKMENREGLLGNKMKIYNTIKDLNEWKTCLLNPETGDVGGGGF